MNKTPKKETHVMRVSTENYEGLKRLKKSKGDTFDSVLLPLIELADKLEHEGCIYVVGNEIFEDQADARGKAIMQAVKEERPPDWPLIAVILGKDDGK